jgi:hypothetical protein
LKEGGDGVVKDDFITIWERIADRQGEVFRTKRGLEFTYRIEGDFFLPSRTDWNITKRDFLKAFELVPMDGPGVINNLVMGPTYVWAVLHDERISKGNW